MDGARKCIEQEAGCSHEYQKNDRNCIVLGLNRYEIRLRKLEFMKYRRAEWLRLAAQIVVAQQITLYICAQGAESHIERRDQF